MEGFYLKIFFRVVQGSTITFLYSLKHHPGEFNDDIAETGTIDKLTFIKLNGPPPAMESNKTMWERALISHFKSDFALHFINTTKLPQAASKVVQRIFNPNIENILPCST